MVNKPLQKLCFVKTKKIGLLAAALAAITVAVLSWMLLQSSPPLDPNAAPTIAGRLSEEELAAQLQTQVEAGSFSCEINPAPFFANAESAGLLAIRNGPTNAQDMRVSITLDATDETVYTGGVLHPGEQTVEGRLTAALAPGSYPATALVEVLKPADTAVAATLQMALTLTIQA